MKHTRLRLAAFTAGTLLWTLCSAAPATRSPADQRLLGIAELWRDVKLFHPALATGKVDWDAALADNLAALQAARTPQELWAALTRFMKPLGDAGLSYGSDRPAPLVARAAAASPVEWLPGDVALVRLHHATSRNEDAALVAAQPEIVARARGVIVDVRPDGPAPVEERVVQQLATRLIDNPVQLPAVRHRTHSGYRPQRTATSGNYHSSFEVVDSELVRPAGTARAVPLVFIVNNLRPLPLVALALQRRGQARIVAQGSLSTAGLLPQRTVLIEDRMAVRFPAGELVYEDGTTGIHADATMPADQAAGPDSPAVGQALKLLGAAQQPGAREYQRLAPAPVRMLEKPYPDMQLPTLAWRQLAAIKLWAVGDAFFPYKEGMAQPWDDSLLRALRQMEQVDSALDYALTLQRMAATLQDSHVMMISAALNKHLGVAGTGVRLGRVEGKIAVARLDPGGAARQAGLQEGDVVLSVDGEEAEARARRLADLLGGSTPAGRDRNGLLAMLRGDENKAAVLQVERGDGQVRTVSLGRRMLAPSVQDPSITPYRLLDARIGYVDLDRLQPQQLDAMFDAVGQTDSLILDMRGYPKVMFNLLADRLNLRGVRPVAIFSRPFLSPERSSSGREVQVQKTAASRFAPYRGKLIMLINEYSQSRAEHSAMFIDAVAPLTLIGSPTAGANGDITDTILPGNILISFTGQEVRHADGRPLQRIGLQPHIPSAPTLAGLRAGRDDVLERAIEFARSGK